jgi:tripartite-type tricarboxylate transporter receptor subunit TctC
MFVTTLPVVNLIATGKLRALAVTAPKRIAALGDIPSILEAGFPGLVTEDWVGFAVKKGTPPEVTARLNDAINRALVKPKVREAFAKLGAEPAGGTPAEFGQLVNNQVEHWANIIKQAEIKLPQ